MAATRSMLGSVDWARFDLDTLPGNHTAPFDLSNEAVHVWRASLNQMKHRLDEFNSLLSSDEKERVNRFYFEKDRDHFIAGRGLLRILLGNYLGKEPAQVHFSYGPYGKPALKPETRSEGIQFNISHSGDLFLLVLGRDRLVGIDVEAVQPAFDVTKFAAYSFSSNENALLASLSGDEKQRAFFKIWTCKEAFSKANGDGLTMPTEESEILLDADGGVQLGNAQKASCWRLETFEPLPAYPASIAIEGHDWKSSFHGLE